MALANKSGRSSIEWLTAAAVPGPALCVSAATISATCICLDGCPRGELTCDELPELFNEMDCETNCNNSWGERVAARSANSEGERAGIACERGTGETVPLVDAEGNVELNEAAKVPPSG